MNSSFWFYSFASRYTAGPCRVQQENLFCLLVCTSLVFWVLSLLFTLQERLNYLFSTVNLFFFKSYFSLSRSPSSLVLHHRVSLVPGKSISKIIIRQTCPLSHLGILYDETISKSFLHSLQTVLLSFYICMLLTGINVRLCKMCFFFCAR